MKIVSQTSAMGFFLLAALQAGDHVEIPALLMDYVQIIIAGLAGLVWWSIRKTFTDHDRRITNLESKEQAHHEALTQLVQDLRITVAELRAVCPFCTPHKIAALPKDMQKR